MEVLVCIYECDSIKQTKNKIDVAKQILSFKDGTICFENIKGQFVSINLKELKGFEYFVIAPTFVDEDELNNDDDDVLPFD